MLEPACLPIRLIALLMDAFLITVLVLFLTSRVILPAADKEGFEQLQKEWQEYSWTAEAARSEGLEPPPASFTEPSQMLMFAAVLITVLLTWFLFVLNELIWRGGSIAKSIFQLRVVHARTLAPLNLPHVLLRATLKTALLLFFLTILVRFPLSVAAIAFFLLAIFPFLNCRRLFLHDLLCRTIVVQKG